MTTLIGSFYFSPITAYEYVRVNITYLVVSKISPSRLRTLWKNTWTFSTNSFDRVFFIFVMDCHDISREFDQEKAKAERNSHSTNRDGKKLN